ncbi:hypothetical protein PMZ80_003518 [Knufia obscura]|uniref:Uncharacterized protein n=1 Tax=Knufia obscura TaxID=1635080 RepID=A0ABR0RUF5_9EURO|nr:hypothetical protein PMZ80_003518 [Knufia obscura]
MASLALLSSQRLPQCELPIIRSTIRPAPGLALNRIAQQTRRLCPAHARCFSTTLYLGPRKKPGSPDYPNFRNETKDQRLVREHKLFNPFSFEDNNPLARLTIPDRYKKRTTQPVSETPSADLEEELLYLATHRPPGARVLNILEHLIADRRERPNASHYEALIHANASPDQGSPHNVQNLLQEMEASKIPMNVNIYTAVLRTLVVHPDTDLLDQVIASCEKMWIPLDSEMLHLISATYLRAGMPELAMDYFDLVEGNASNAVQSGSSPVRGAVEPSGKVELWLYVLFIYHLAIQRDWDGVIRMCYRLNDDETLEIPFAMRQIDVPHSFWHWLLDHVVTTRHSRSRKRFSQRWLMLWICDLWVRRAWIRPAHDTCLKLLRVCSKQGLYQSAELVQLILQSSKRNGRHVIEAGPGSGEAGEARDEADLASEAEIREFVHLSYENAEPKVPRMTERDKQQMFPHWWMFDDTVGVEKETGTPIRIDAWSALSDGNDPGRAWPRTVREREQEQKQKEEQEQNRKAAVQQKYPGQVMLAVRAWPGQLQDDLDALASLRAAVSRSDEETKIEQTIEWIPSIAEPVSVEPYSAPQNDDCTAPKMASEIESQAYLPSEQMASTDADSLAFGRGNDRNTHIELGEVLATNCNSLASSFHEPFFPQDAEGTTCEPVPVDSVTAGLLADGDNIKPTTSCNEYADNLVAQHSAQCTSSEPQRSDRNIPATVTKKGTMTSDAFFEMFEASLAGGGGKKKGR